MSKDKLSTDSYKGVRDFYPEDLSIQKYIFSVWREVVEQFGYVEYNASVLEPSELYRAKTGEEIVNEQTYTFIDRGNREVTLRPEMTPTVARMIAARRRELPFPIRWYSIPNLFRYERPQRGRLREHWQLNVDAFGIQSLDAEFEMIQIASALMKKFGLVSEQFTIKLNSRKSIVKHFVEQGLTHEQIYKVQKLLDKKNKINDFNEQLKMITDLPISFEIKTPDTIQNLLDKAHALGISNIVFDPLLMRGFDYYTDIVFEVFDTHPDNNRSLFGGGRYDELLSLFDNESIAAVGFGMGDVTIRDVLETYNLLPDNMPTTDVTICTHDDEGKSHAHIVAEQLRQEGYKVSVDFSDRKLKDQIKRASDRGSRFILCLGEEESQTLKYTLRNLSSGKEHTGSLQEIITSLT